MKKFIKDSTTLEKLEYLMWLTTEIKTQQFQLCELNKHKVIFDMKSLEISHKIKISEKVIGRLEERYDRVLESCSRHKESRLMSVREAFYKK